MKDKINISDQPTPPFKKSLEDNKKIQLLSDSINEKISKIGQLQHTTELLNVLYRHQSLKLTYDQKFEEGDNSFENLYQKNGLLNKNYLKNEAKWMSLEME